MVSLASGPGSGGDGRPLQPGSEDGSGMARGAAAPSAAAQALRDGRPIDVNTARESDLALLPRIGPSLAHRIVEARERGGPFQSLAELRRVHGIGPRIADELARWLSFEPPGTDASPGVASRRGPSPGEDGHDLCGRLAQ